MQGEFAYALKAGDTEGAMGERRERAALRLRTFPSTIANRGSCLKHTYTVVLGLEDLPRTGLMHSKIPPTQSREAKVYGQTHTPSHSTPGSPQTFHAIYPTWVTAHCSRRDPTIAPKSTLLPEFLLCALVLGWALFLH